MTQHPRNFRPFGLLAVALLAVGAAFALAGQIDPSIAVALLAAAPVAIPAQGGITKSPAELADEARMAAGLAAYDAAKAAGLSPEQANAAGDAAAARAYDEALAAAQVDASRSDSGKEADKTKGQRQPRQVKARVLYDGPHGKVNDVVLVSAEVARRDEHLDADPAAVAYAEGLRRG